LKWEDIYLNEYATPRDLRRGIASYIKLYNTVRPHDAHGNLTPQKAYERPFKTIGAKMKKAA
jgi:putative transposase